MYHSIIFLESINSINAINTWGDWHLVPSSRPVFNPPKMKTNYIDIPGGDSCIDASEFLTGYPVYYNREGSIEFIVMNGYDDWYKIYSNVMNYLHGKELIAILEDDPEHFYIGRFFVNQWMSDSHYSKITIDYNVKPYKYNVAISELVCSSTSEETEYMLSASDVGRKPLSPTLIVNATDDDGIDIRLVNEELNIDVNSHFDTCEKVDSDFMISGINENNVNKIYVKGNGTVTIKFRGGSL